MSEAPKVIVIGLDGATPELIQQWTDSGELPTLKKLTERGTFIPLRSTTPPISPVAWSTFMTGMNPAGHGILGFRNLDARRYEFHEPAIVSSKPIAGRTFWDYAGRHGHKVGVFWVPITYPPWPVNGLLISGYPTPGSARSYGYPEKRAAEIPGLTENSAFFNSARPEQVRGELLRLAKDRGREAADAMRRDSFDLFVMVIGSTDRAQHDFWRHHDPSAALHDPDEAKRLGSTIQEVYRAADRAVGDVIASAPDDANVFIVSDHGGGPTATRQVHLNVWLREHGYLVVHPDRVEGSSAAGAYRWLKERIPFKEQIFRRLPQPLRARLTSFDADATLNLRAVNWSETKAYRFPMYPPFEGIAINLKDRQPAGAVSLDEYEPLCDHIIESLSQVTDPKDGRPVVKAVVRREEIYSGEHLERFPDLIVEWNAGYSGGPGIAGDWVVDVPARQLKRLSGAHTMDGILIAAGPAIQNNAPLKLASIADIAPTVLRALGLSRPDAMAGRVLEELLEPVFVSNHPVRSIGQKAPADKPSQAVLSDDEQAEIAEHLRGLGYID